jgi:hypothetical protein
MGLWGHFDLTIPLAAADVTAAFLPPSTWQEDFFSSGVFL